MTKHAIVGSVMLVPDGNVLIASDRFMRLAEPFAVYEMHVLLDACRKRCLRTLIVELCALEVGDREGRRYPRVKINDDGAALLCAVE